MSTKSIILLFSFLCGFSCHAKDGVARNVSVFEGLYYFGHEVNVFRPCHGVADYWLIGKDELVSELAKRYSRHAKKPYQPIYVVLKGQLKFERGEGFAKDYEGQFELLEIVNLDKNKECPRLKE